MGNCRKPVMTVVCGSLPYDDIGGPNLQIKQLHTMKTTFIIMPGRAQNMWPGMRPGIAKNIPILISNVVSYPRSRYFSSKKIHEPFPYYFCSLNRLAHDIGSTYYEMQFLFDELSEHKVEKIVNSVKNGTYTQSPLILYAFDRKIDPRMTGFFHTFQVKDEPNISLGISPTQEDSLVLMALGRMLSLNILHENILDENILADKSFCFKTTNDEFYSTVCARGKVLRLYKCDLTSSLRTINRETLLLSLSHIVKDDAIMELVGKFLYSTILDQSGRDFTAEMRCSIPPAKLLTEVLLNYALTEFDHEFQRAFPCVDYSRYLHEVLVSFPNITSTCSSNIFESEDVSFFNEEVLRLLDQLNLDGRIISIGPGDAPAHCYKGIVWVSQDGEIKVKERIF
ncbi:hypothetical protein SLA2020_490490 [Shorea laevis]